MFVRVANNSIVIGVAAGAVVRAVATGARLPLPAHLHLLPYPGRGPAGLGLTTEIKGM